MFFKNMFELAVCQSKAVFVRPFRRILVYSLHSGFPRMSPEYGFRTRTKNYLLWFWVIISASIKSTILIHFTDIMKMIYVFNIQYP